MANIRISNWPMTATTSRAEGGCKEGGAESSAEGSDQNGQGHPKNDREPSFSERLGVTTSSKFKAQNFSEGLCVRRRQFNRGAPGGGLARSSAAIYG